MKFIVSRSFILKEDGFFIKPTKRNVSTMSLFGMGVPEVAIIAGVAALVLGPSKLPELGKTLGKSVKSFQSATKEFEKELKSAISEELIMPNEDNKPEKSNK